MPFPGVARMLPEGPETVKFARGARQRLTGRQGAAGHPPAVFPVSGSTRPLKSLRFSGSFRMGAPLTAAWSTIGVLPSGAAAHWHRAGYQTTGKESRRGRRPPPLVGASDGEGQRGGRTHATAPRSRPAENRAGLEARPPTYDLVRTEFYHGWFGPQDLHHRLCGVLRRHEATAVYLTLMRPTRAEAFGADERARLALVVPHLQRALELHRRVAVLRREREITQLALDRLPTGILFVDREARPIARNRRAEEMLEAGDLVRLVLIGPAQLRAA
jgi:PAS domain-containing protein